MALMALGLAAGQLASGLLGRQNSPEKAQLERVDMGASFSEGLGINEDNFDRINSLTGQADTATQERALKLMETALPGFSNIRDRLLSQVNKDLDNQYTLPQEVEDNLFRTAAERGIGVGTAGQTRNFSVMRDLGVNITEYSQMKRLSALQTLQQVVGMTPRVNPTSPMSMFMNPNAVAQQRANENAMKFQNDQQYNNAVAATRNANAKLLADAVGGAIGTLSGSIGSSSAMTDMTFHSGTGTPSFGNFSSGYKFGQNLDLSF
jgi:hypothetical protein